MKVQKVGSRLILALGLTCLLSALALLIDHGSVLAINGFSDNQELPLPALAGQLPVRFIVRGLEPSVRVAPDGTVYVSSIRGVPTGVDLHRYYVAIDGPSGSGGTYPFRYEGQPDDPTHGLFACGIFASGCNFTGTAEGGGDVDIAVNYPTSGTPNLALVSLTLAPGVTGTHSTDRGDSFSTPNPAVALIPGDDRQWIDGTDAQTVYLNYHDAGTFNIEVQRSNDGGVTYINGFGEAIDPQTFPTAGGVPATNSANVAGQIKVDRSSCPSSGNLYTIFVAPDSVAENLSGGALRSVYVAASTDVKLGLPAFTFTDTKVFTSPAGSPGAMFGTNQVFPALAVDGSGFVYTVWSDNSNIFYSFSSDQGTTWSNPINVSFPVNGGHANVFPWIAADANGHVGIVWFGDDRAGNSNDRAALEPGHPPSQGAACNDNTITCMTKWAQWKVYYAESVNGHDATPLFARNVISDHVIHRGTISTGGLGGGADRSLADLFQIAFDPQHRANVAFSDDHLINTEVSGSDNGPDNPTSRRKIRANFTHQLTPNPGIVTTGTCATQPPPPGAEKITGGGRIQSQTSGRTANFGFVAMNDKPNASLSFHDDGATRGSIDVHSSNITEPTVTFRGNCATFSGSAKVNQQPGYTYTVDACDNNDPNSGGAGQDTFFITVKNAAGSVVYSNGGVITSGDIEIHIE
jgi:hypothetical protein